MPIVNHLKDMAGVEEHGSKGLWTDMDNSGTIFSRSLENQESVLDDPEITPEDKTTIFSHPGLLDFRVKH